jgi:hypothetical protein
MPIASTVDWSDSICEYLVQDGESKLLKSYLAGCVTLSSPPCACVRKRGRERASTHTRARADLSTVFFSKIYCNNYITFQAYKNILFSFTNFLLPMIVARHCDRYTEQLSSKWTAVGVCGICSVNKCCLATRQEAERSGGRMWAYTIKLKVFINTDHEVRPL